MAKRMELFTFTAETPSAQRDYFFSVGSKIPGTGGDDRQTKPIRITKYILGRRARGAYGESVSPRFSINNTLLRDLCASNESSFQDEWAVKILLLILHPLSEKNGVTWVDPSLQI